MANKVFRAIGFCGIDDSVPPQLAVIISEKYSFVEWGILFRTDLQGSARYASMQWVEKLSNICKLSTFSVRLAAHLCGDRCMELLTGNFQLVRQLQELGFQRIQINPTRANDVIVDPSQMGTYVENLRLAFFQFPEIEWLFQLNTETNIIWQALYPSSITPNVSLLHDASCGKGIEIQEFASPSTFPNVPCGYAGGLGPANIASVMSAIMGQITISEADKLLWVDMESSLRSIVVNTKTNETTDVFDISTVMRCILSASELGMH